MALAGQDNYMEQYNKALIQEISAFSRQNSTDNKQKIKSIFFGGGTPSTYPKNLLLDTFGIINKEFNIDKDCEITIEVNPGTVDLPKLELWKSVGINRLSIGVQSLDDNVLKKLNRHQTAQDVFNLLEIASNLFDNISIDLIVGLPEVTEDYWNSMTDQIVNWPINHVSMYFLTVHEDTPLYFGIKKNKIILPTEDSTVDLYLKTVEKFNRAGLAQYEISNFARTGFECKHNLGYWNGVSYKGFGLGAFSFDGEARFQNEKNLLKYMKNAEDNNLTPIFYELLTQEQIKTEKVMLGLRQKKGVPLELILDNCSDQKKELILNILVTLEKEELIMFKNNKAICVTNKGLPVVNEILIKILI